MNKILQKIEDKTGIRNLTGHILNQLSGTQFNSFILELFRKRAAKLTPSSVLEEFNKSRFFMTSAIDTIYFKEEEIKWLRRASEFGFKPIQLSPLTPLGTSTSVAYVDQNNIVSAVRGTEVVSDATNVLALKAAGDIKSMNAYNKYCTTHRHVRGQYFTNPNLSAHFGLFCMITPGLDKGSYKFELEQLEEHLAFYLNMLTAKYAPNDISLKLFIRDSNEQFKTKLEECLNQIKEKWGININTENKRNDYYQTVQFKFFIKYKNELLDVADGGFVNWTQKLLSNRKQRLLISAAGLELIIKIDNGLIL